MISRNIFNFMSKPVRYTLGRWGVVCENSKNIVTDRANVDHCGPCGTDNVVNAEERMKEIEKNIEFYKSRQRSKDDQTVI